ncbi:MAG: FHA domain-containing protein [bacterium]|nr:FHA domain-containing protein [bacterium]
MNQRKKIKIAITCTYVIAIATLFMNFMMGVTAVDILSQSDNLKMAVEFMGWDSTVITLIRLMLIVPVVLTVAVSVYLWMSENRSALICACIASILSILIYAVAFIAVVAMLSYAQDEAEQFLGGSIKGVSPFDLFGIGYWLFFIVHIAAVILSFQSGNTTPLSVNTNNPVIKEAVNVINNIPKAVEAISGGTGSIIGTCGVYNGNRIELKVNEQLMIGRDSSMCNLIIVAPKVSRKHCLIQYLGSTGYKVTDFSSNGTYKSTGERLPKNFPTIVAQGTVIAVGNQDNMFRLG